MLKLSIELIVDENVLNSYQYKRNSGADVDIADTWKEHRLITKVMRI